MIGLTIRGQIYLGFDPGMISKLAAQREYTGGLGPPVGVSVSREAAIDHKLAAGHP